MLNTVSIQLPKILKFTDYHQIIHFASVLNKFTPSSKVRHKELPSNDGFYYGLFYVGDLPTDTEIAQLKTKA